MSVFDKLDRKAQKAAFAHMSAADKIKKARAPKGPLSKLNREDFDRELTEARQGSLHLRRQRDMAQHAGSTAPSDRGTRAIEQRARDAEAENARRIDSTHDALERNTAAAFRDWKPSGDAVMDRLDLDLLYHSARGADLKGKIKARMDALPAPQRLVVAGRAAEMIKSAKSGG